ncbi:MAG: autotransporter-associated beta strand repeat-containing protein, partial [Planctomycetaceae bacterium]|nr:autotransporter-associated beta strand repeat-containing protein [Planctomycetaceae bacterium]
FRQHGDTVLFGIGTIEASTILLGGTINAGVHLPPPRVSEIKTLDFIGSATIGDLRNEGLGITKMYIDLNPAAAQEADLISVDGTLTLTGETTGNRTLNDLDTSAIGKFLIAQTTGGILGWADSGMTGELVQRQMITENFDTLVAGKAVNTYRFNIYYTVENYDEINNVYRDAYLNIALTEGQLVWNGTNADVYGSTTSGDNSFKNKWVNDPAYNWENYDGLDDYTRPISEVALRFRQMDRVVFDSKADAARQPEWEEIRKNIEIITHTFDNTPGSLDQATVRDMVVLGGGTFRFTGKGINGVFDEEWFAKEDEYQGGQLLVSGYSTVLFDNEPNNFQRGIVLQDGAIGFSDENQLGTLWEVDPENDEQKTTRGILVYGSNSYGLLYVNADGKTLQVPIVIQESNSEFIVNTDGNDFGNNDPDDLNRVSGNYDLTIAWVNDDSKTMVKTEDGDIYRQNGISGAGKLVKEGSGTLTLADENYYEGGTDILGGTIAVAADNRLGKSDSRVYFDGGTLNAMESFATDRTAILDDNGGTLEVNSGKNLTWNALVTGTGNLTTTGPGTVILKNTANEYTGNTVVAEGRLVAEGIGTLGPNNPLRSITTTLLNPDTKERSVLELRLNNSETLNQTLLGSGEVQKTGTGDLVFGQSSDEFRGRFNFNDGNVYLNNAEFRNSDSFLVGTGTTLYGTGWLGSRGSEGGIIQKGAKLIPNGVIANDPNINPTAAFLNISGDLSFERSSLYQVVLTQYNDSTYDPENPNRMRPVNDKIIVDAGGTVTIDDGAELEVLIDYWADNLSEYDFGESTSGKFTIIDAEYGNVDDPDTKFVLHDMELPRGVELWHGWNDSLYQLWFVGNPSGGFVEIGITHNQKEIGKQLDYLTQMKDPGIRELIRILSQKEITDDMVRDVLGQLAGDLRANSLGMALKTPWRHPFNRVDRDMFPRQFDPCAPITCRPEYKYKKEFWAEGFARYANTRYDGNSYANKMRREE